MRSTDNVKKVVMKAKVKSKFVYPDKLYARTNDNITLDISYAPQTIEAVEYVRSDAFVEKACELLVNCIEDFMARRMEIWDEECKKQTLENLKNKLWHI